MCTVINNIETSRRNSYTWLHPFTYWRQMRKSHSDAVEITLKNWYLLPAFGCAAQKWRQTGRGIPTVTWRQYGKRAIFVSGDVTFQDGDAVDLGKLGGPLSLVYFFLSMYAPCAWVCVIMYTRRTTVLLWYSGLCDIRVLFMYDGCQYSTD